MSEKYTRVYHSTDLLYAESSPVIVMARALLKDNGTGGIFAQLKFKSISDKAIKAIKVKIIPLDTTGTLIGDAVEHTYLDLKISRNQEFGSKEIISISEITARAFDVSIKQVVFADNSVWEYDGNEYQKIDNLISLNKKISNPELIKQYKIELGDDSNYVPMKVKDLWVCTCGNYNHISEEKCKNCGKAFEKEIELLDLNVLQEKYKERLEKEAEEKRVAEEKQRIAEEEKRIATEKATKKLKKTIAISLPIICVIIAFVIVMNTVIIPKQKYNKAMNLIDSEQFEEAYKILEEIGSSDVIASSKYDRAVALIDSGDYETAYILLNGLEYKDSTKKLSSIKSQYEKVKLSKAQVGSVVYFGSYEQDNKISNGKEDIKWIVLAKEGGRALVISKYALDYQPYNTYCTDVTWETCSLRKWLNDTFLNVAFSSVEQEMIQTSSVTADKNPLNSTSSGNNTIDKVFLLSITEANKYFSSDIKRRCASTGYTEAQGERASNSYSSVGGTESWWLRSSGKYSDYAAYVGIDGSIYISGCAVDGSVRCGDAVRPAMWISLE